MMWCARNRTKFEFTCDRGPPFLPCLNWSRLQRCYRSRLQYTSLPSLHLFYFLHWVIWSEQKNAIKQRACIDLHLHVRQKRMRNREENTWIWIYWGDILVFYSFWALHYSLKIMPHFLCSQVLEVVGGRRAIDNRALLAQSIFETSCRYSSLHKSYMALASKVKAMYPNPPPKKNLHQSLKPHQADGNKCYHRMWYCVWVSGVWRWDLRCVCVHKVAPFGCRVFFPHDLDAMAGRVLAEGGQE